MQGNELDLCLSFGYFRMHQDLFTCRYLLVNDAVFPVHWLRISLPDVAYKAKQRSLFRRNGSFSVTVTPFVLTDEINALYTRYRSAVDFEAPESVETWLMDGALQNAFDTHVVEVRDNDRLIAVGIFDKGARSIAGIMNFYDPAYRKHSLGKYLMLLKIDHARHQQKRFYYPGYVVSNNPKFDYKLFADEAATEVFDERAGQWIPFSWETVHALAADLLADLSAPG